MFRTLLITIGVAGLVVLSACKTEDDYRRERAEKAVRYFERSKLLNHELEGDVKMNLAQCIQKGLKHNLDIKVLQQEEDIASEMRTAELLGMLPELNISDHLSGRSNTPASSSESYKGEGLTYGASQSQDKTINVFNIDLALSILDFGLAFFNSQQAHDRYLMRKQRTERMAQNLIMDIIHAYCRVAAAQRAVSTTKALLQNSRAKKELIKQLAKAKKITPLRAFEETRDFVEMERRLTVYTLDYYNSCVELRSLLGYYPSDKITVDDSFLDKIPDNELPDIEVMEQIALIRRPELRELDIQRHINAVECHKVIVTMFPNARVFLDFNASDNSFLYNKNWWEVGITAAFNLLKLPQKVAQLVAYSKQTDAEAMRVYSQSIAIIAQVRISQSNIRANRDIFMQVNRTYDNYKKTLDSAKSKTNVSSAGDLSRLELDHMEMTTAESYIEKTLALANYYVSFYRLMNALGMNEYKTEAMNRLPAELQAAQKEAGIVLAKAKK